jgi:DNA-directed RNA polymerase specialized sigma24 family protein
MAIRGITWAVTPEAFESLLYSFHSDRDQAGRAYENLRRKLLEFFEARGSHTPDEHADETFDRVMRRITEGEKVENPAAYCYGVAKFVWKEATRQLAKEPVELDENVLSPLAANGHDPELELAREMVERRLDCLEKCLDHLADETREFIVEYYKEENGIKIEQRKLLAERLNTTLNALRLRASRLRRELGKCTEKCVEQNAAGSDNRQGAK